MNANQYLGCYMNTITIQLHIGLTSWLVNKIKLKIKYSYQEWRLSQENCLQLVIVLCVNDDQIKDFDSDFLSSQTHQMSMVELHTGVVLKHVPPFWWQSSDVWRDPAICKLRPAVVDEASIQRCHKPTWVDRNNILRTHDREPSNYVGLILYVQNFSDET